MKFSCKASHLLYSIAPVFFLFSSTHDIYVEYGFMGGRAVGGDGDGIDVNGDSEVMAT